MAAQSSSRVFFGLNYVGLETVMDFLSAGDAGCMYFVSKNCRRAFCRTVVPRHVSVYCCVQAANAFLATAVPSLRMIVQVALHGRVDVLELLLNAYEAAEEAGTAPMDDGYTSPTPSFEFEYTGKLLNDGTDIACAAASRGHTSALQFLASRPRNYGCFWHNWVSSIAAFYGHLETIRFLATRRIVPSHPVLEPAAASGNLELVKFLVDRPSGRPSTEWVEKNVVRCAAQFGHVHILQYLYERGFRAESCAIAYAAQEGQIDAIRFLRANQAPWSAVAVHKARQANRPEVAQWLVGHGCPNVLYDRGIVFYYN